MSSRPAAIRLHRQDRESRAWLEQWRHHERRRHAGRLPRFHRVKTARCLLCWQPLEGSRPPPGLYEACSDCAENLPEVDA